MIKKNNNKGFTLAELLIVVAIIAVLVAIAIPVFTTQLEKSREATDISNVRSAYAEAMAAYMADGAKETKTATATAKQTREGWTGESGQVVARIDGTETVKTYAAKTSGSVWTVHVAPEGTTTSVWVD